MNTRTVLSFLAILLLGVVGSLADVSADKVELEAAGAGNVVAARVRVFFCFCFQWHFYLFGFCFLNGLALFAVWYLFSVSNSLDSFAMLIR